MPNDPSLPSQKRLPSVAFTFDLREPAPRPIITSLKRGFFGRCPRCGKGRIFRAYLKVNDACPRCGEELHHHRADDAPPYLTIVAVGHVVLGLMLSLELVGDDIPLWAHMLAWPALAIILSLWWLPLFKGALIAYQWAFRMHGFEGASAAALAPPRGT